MDSWASRYILEELTANHDGGVRSFYFYKPADEDKLYCGPVWDYDYTFGVGIGLSNPKVLYYQNTKTAWSHTDYALYPRLTEVDGFMERVRQIYAETYRPLIDVLLGEAASDGTENGLKSIQEEGAAISASWTMNFKRWHHLTNGTIEGHYSTQEKSNAYLENFLRERVEYLDSLWLE